MAELEDYYSMLDIMSYLDICRDTILSWIATKGIHAHKIGKKYKCKLSEIDQWINSG